jgi:uncharacterized membrane protein
MARGTGQALLIGITAGMRCFLAPAIVVSRQTSCSSAMKTAATVAAVGELAADKTPYIGSRLEAGPLAGRVVAGAICGALVASERTGSAPLGFVVGGIAAFASAHLFYHLRRTSTELGIPDFAFALAEDSAALAIGSRACSTD